MSPESPIAQTPSTAKPSALDPLDLARSNASALASAEAAAVPLRGVFAAALTPMRPDGAPDHSAMLAHCRWLLSHGCDGVAPLGTTGEANSMAVEQRLGLIAELGASFLGSQLLVGIGSCALAETVRLGRAALDAGCPNVLVLPPFYYKNPTEDGLFAFYAGAIDGIGSADLRVYLYHFPAMSAVPITHGLIERLLKAYPAQVAGLKDSTGDWAVTEALCTAFPGFGVFTGNEVLLARTVAAGGAGCITAATNITAPVVQTVYHAATKGGDAARQQDLLARTRAVLLRYPAIPALKALTRRRSGAEIWRRIQPPNLPLPPDQEAQLVAELDALGLFAEAGYALAGS